MHWVILIRVDKHLLGTEYSKQFLGSNTSDRLTNGPRPLEDAVGAGHAPRQLHVDGVLAADGAVQGVARAAAVRHGQEVLVQTPLGVPGAGVAVAAQPELVPALR